jgi:hypothetical protein
VDHGEPGEWIAGLLDVVARMQWSDGVKELLIWHASLDDELNGRRCSGFVASNVIAVVDRELKRGSDLEYLKTSFKLCARGRLLDGRPKEENSMNLWLCIMVRYIDVGFIMISDRLGMQDGMGRTLSIRLGIPGTLTSFLILLLLLLDFPHIRLRILLEFLGRRCSILTSYLGSLLIILVTNALPKLLCMFISLLRVEVTGMYSFEILIGLVPPGTALHDALLIGGSGSVAVSICRGGAATSQWTSAN